MGLVDDVEDYVSFAGFEEIYLEDSWITQMTAHPGRLEIEVLLVLTERHAEYKKPSLDDQYCYRPGRILFENVRSLEWAGQGTPPAMDATGELDWGNIDSLKADKSVYLIEGEVGRLAIESDPPILHLAPLPMDVG